MGTFNSRSAVAFRSIFQSGIQVAQSEAFSDAQLKRHGVTFIGKNSRVESFVLHIIVATLPVAAANHERSLECLSVGRHVGSGHRSTRSVLVCIAVTVADWYCGLENGGRTVRVGGRDWNNGSAGRYRTIVSRTGTGVLCKSSRRVGCD